MSKTSPLGTVCVTLPTQDHYDKLMQALEDYNERNGCDYAWIFSEKKPKELNFWKKYKENTGISFGGYTLYYNTIDFIKKVGIKEMSFEEAIRILESKGKNKFFLKIKNFFNSLTK